MDVEQLARETASKLHYNRQSDWNGGIILKALRRAVKPLLEVMQPVSDAQQRAWCESQLKNLPVTTIELELVEIMAIAFK